MPWQPLQALPRLGRHVPARAERGEPLIEDSMANGAALTPAAFVERAAAAIEALRTHRPRVHCLTNAVVLELTANTLLALGAVPSMTSSADEVEDFVGGAGALLINLGTLEPQRRVAIGLALDAAARAGVPWVLDPVLIDRSGVRAAYAHELTAHTPAAVRCNAAEAATLGSAQAAALARHLGAVAAVTGAVDRVSDGGRTVGIEAGDPLMDRVTGVGCAGTAMVAAFLAVERDPLVATVAAVAALGIAGEVAAARSSGPGTFKAALLDALASLDARNLDSRVAALKITPTPAAHA